MVLMAAVKGQSPLHFDAMKKKKENAFLTCVNTGRNTTPFLNLKKSKNMMLLSATNQRLRMWERQSAKRLSAKTRNESILEHPLRMLLVWIARFYTNAFLFLQWKQAKLFFKNEVL